MMIIKTAIVLSAAGLALMYTFLLAANMLINYWEKRVVSKVESNTTEAEAERRESE